MNIKKIIWIILLVLNTDCSACYSDTGVFVPLHLMKVYDACLRVNKYFEFEYEVNDFYRCCGDGCNVMVLMMRGTNSATSL